MKRSTVLIFFAVIVVLAAIIVAGIFALYSGVDQPETVKAPVAATQPAEQQSDVAQAQPVAEQPAAEQTVAEPEVVQKENEQEVVKKEEKPVPASFTVTNCATGKKNTLRQNGDNSLSLVDHQAKQLWKISFPGKICGVAEIDYYSNGKIQFLIPQGRQLHIIDRLGREVKQFPIALPSEAVSGPRKEKTSVPCWSIKTEKGTVYFTVKNKISTKKPE